MKNHQSDLVGLFLILDSSDHEHYRTGAIVAAVGDCFLVQFDNVDETGNRPLPPMELYTPEELSDSCESCGQKRQLVQDTRGDGALDCVGQ